MTDTHAPKRAPSEAEIAQSINDAKERVEYRGYLGDFARVLLAVAAERDALRAERDSWHRVAISQEHSIATARERADSAEAALRKYSDHLDACTHWAYNNPDQKVGQCNCGFAEVLAWLP